MRPRGRLRNNRPGNDNSPWKGRLDIVVKIFMFPVRVAASSLTQTQHQRSVPR